MIIIIMTLKMIAVTRWYLQYYHKININKLALWGSNNDLLRSKKKNLVHHSEQNAQKCRLGQNYLFVVLASRSILVYSWKIWDRLHRCAKKYRLTIKISSWATNGQNPTLPLFSSQHLTTCKYLLDQYVFSEWTFSWIYQTNDIK